MSAYMTRIVVALLLAHIAAFASAAATPPPFNEETLVRVSPRPAVVVVLPPLAQFPEFTDGEGLRTVDSPFHVGGETKAQPRMAPSIGQHTRDLLAEFGCSQAQIEALAAE